MGMLRIAPALELTAPDGSAVPIREVRCEAAWVGDQFKEAVLHFEVSPETWARIDAGGWFRMPPTERGPCFAGGFHEGAPIEVEARLAPDVALLLSLLSTDEWDLAARILSARDLPDLHRTESWLGVVVKQARGPVKTGFATRRSGLLAS